MTCRYASTSHLPVCLNLCQSSPILTLLFRFLGAHDYDDTDRQFEGMIRVIVHSRENLAVIWEFVKVDDNTYIMVKENRDRTAKDTVGWYVAVPPDSKRDSESNYLAITNDIAKAMPVTTKFATPDIFHTPRA